MIKELIFICPFLVLTGCATEKVQPIPFGMLPAITQLTMPVSSAPTQAEWLKAQPLAERAALAGFIKTQQTPVIETTQFIQFPFGRMTPQISCSPLHTCDIALQPGEKVTGVYPGDTARWLFEEALSHDQQMHVIFKPKEPDIATNTIITTSRRTYHLDLVSKKEVSPKPVSFYYPDDFLQSWQNLQDAAKTLIKEEQSQTAANAEKFNHLNFNYHLETSLLSEKPRWTPQRVFNNGKQVYVEMPSASETIPLPALFIIGKTGEPELVNYRIRKPYYIIDQLFQKAVLVSGIGKNQQRVTIIYDDK
jgi:P-type conjugative transfer protein TrbG